MADAYADWYESLGDAVPSAYRESSYRDRLATAFPFHPELVDILTNRWGSLSGFQRTRGALRTLAHTVKALSQRGHLAALIHSGDVVLADPGIRGEVLRFAGESYKAALNADIIRADSKAAEEDRRRGGQVQERGLATGLATTAFLHSHGSDRVLGASPGTFLVRASTIKELLAKRRATEPAAGEAGQDRTFNPSPEQGPETQPEAPQPGSDQPGAGSTTVLRAVTIRVKAVPGSAARDVVKVAVLPLNAVSADVTLDVTIRADGGLGGIPRETLNLVVLEGLRQLGLGDVEVTES